MLLLELIILRIDEILGLSTFFSLGIFETEYHLFFGNNTLESNTGTINIPDLLFGGNHG